MSKPKIEVVQADTIEWMRVGDFAPNSSQQMITPDNLDTKIKFLFAEWLIG